MLLINRDLANIIIEMAKMWPVISITGPRQSGKTTLSKLCFPDYEYVNLENPETIDRLKADPKSFLTNFTTGIIIDEAQKFPELFSWIQVISDERKSVGEFILTGSEQFLLNQKIAQSLAGRVFVSHLLPLSIHELSHENLLSDRFENVIFSGFYPRIVEKSIPANLFYPSYIETYLERDVRSILQVSNLNLFRKFLKLSAGRIGQLVNYASLSNEVGVDLKTIKSWFSVLETSFIVFFLQPHHQNFNKKIVKTPKLYFYDVGLAVSLLGLESESDLQNHWARGALFENLIIAELVKTRFNQGKSSNLFFWRNNTGNEVDCIIETASDTIPVEIKSSSTINNDFFKGLNYYNQLKEKQSEAYLIYGGLESYKRQKNNVLSWKNSFELLLDY
jgi:uncharacterized protein